MKLTSINCPNCNGQLKEEGGKLICMSCGGAFAIDYDEADVEHEKLQTEAERERIRVEREKELMATKIRLEEESQMRKAAAARSQASRGLMKFLLIPVIFLVFSLVSSIVFFAFMRSMSKRSTDRIFNQTGKNTTATVTMPQRDVLTKDDILGDETFIENALASGKSFAKTKHAGGVHDWDLKSELNLANVPTAKLSGDPRLENVYLLDTDTENYFIMIYALDYTFPDDGIDNVKTLYFSCYLWNLSKDGSGKIATDYQVNYDSGTGVLGLFNAYADKDQLYRETVLAKGGNVTDLTADLVKEN